jgi:hypothetical protein
MRVVTNSYKIKTVSKWVKSTNKIKIIYQFKISINQTKKERIQDQVKRVTLKQRRETSQLVEKVWKHHLLEIEQLRREMKVQIRNHK